MYVRAKSLQWCPTLCDSTDCSSPGASVHGILQARTLEWVAIPFTKGSSQSRDRTCVSHVSCIAGRLFTAEPPGSPGVSHLVSNVVLLGVRTDPVMLGQDAQAVAARIESFVAGGLPALSSAETVQMQVQIWPGSCGWLWIVFHALLSSKGRRPFTVATGLASRARAAVAALCPASGPCALCWGGVIVGTGATCRSIPPDDAEQDSGWSRGSSGV